MLSRLIRAACSVVWLRHVLVVAIGIGIADYALAQQPRYEGRQLSEWDADLRDLSIRVRLKAVEALGHFGTAAVPSLARALIDGDQSVARAAEDQLKRIGPAGIPGLAPLQGQPLFGMALKSLWWAVSDAPYATRKAALQALQTLSSSTALPVLLSGIGHSDEEVRDICIRAIGVMGPEAKTAAPTIASAFSRNPDAAGFALGSIGPEALPILLRRAKEQNPLIRMSAVAGLIEMSQGLRDPYGTQQRPVDARFRDGLGPKLAGETADVLIPLLLDVNVVGSVPALLVALVPASIGPMLRALNSGNEPLRRQVLLVFQSVGAYPPAATDAIAELRKAGQSNNPSTRSAVSAAMEAIERRR